MLTHDRETTWHQQSIDIRDKLQKNQENMVDSMNAISQGLTDLKLELLNEKIERMRWRILDFATTLQNGHEAGTEQFRNVLDTYTEYEELLERLGKTNGLVDASISFIQHKYQDLLNGDEKHDNG